MIKILIYNGAISERFLIEKENFHCYATDDSIYFYKGAQCVFQKFIDRESVLNVDFAMRSISKYSKITFIENPKTKKLIGAQYV